MTPLDPTAAVPVGATTPPDPPVDGAPATTPAEPTIRTDLATLRVLRVLLDGRACPMGEIAARAMLLDATAARIVERLARAGWVDRGHDPGHPHRVLIGLTDLGRTRHQQHTSQQHTSHSGTARGNDTR